MAHTGQTSATMTLLRESAAPRLPMTRPRISCSTMPRTRPPSRTNSSMPRLWPTFLRARTCSAIISSPARRAPVGRVGYDAVETWESAYAVARRGSELTRFYARAPGRASPCASMLRGSPADPDGVLLDEGSGRRGGAGGEGGAGHGDEVGRQPLGRPAAEPDEVDRPAERGRRRQGQLDERAAQQVVGHGAVRHEADAQPGPHHLLHHLDVV